MQLKTSIAGYGSTFKLWTKSTGTGFVSRLEIFASLSNAVLLTIPAESTNRIFELQRRLSGNTLKNREERRFTAKATIVTNSFY